MQRLVQVAVDDGVAIVRLHDPPSNQISVPMASMLASVATEVATRADVGAVVIAGSDRTFSTGGDLDVMASQSAASMRDVLLAVGGAVATVEAIPKVVIAAVEGFCLGGGCELALAADFRFAGSGARLGQPEIRFGMIPGAGATQRLPRLVGRARAKDLIYSGRSVRAAEALDMGLVDRVVDRGTACEVAVEAARGYARTSPEAIAAAKAAIHAEGVDLDARLAQERELLCALFDSGAPQRAMRAFLDERTGS
ncbi:MAG TPA: enoyl-CoA hydratase/isomerase family protein [Actinomycetota bacterium]|nr:enoyl-CoA hydratase/isomerase family protein [Actinomycetota bacterium]